MNYSLKEILMGIPLMLLFSPIIVIIMILLIFDEVGQRSLSLAYLIMDWSEPIIERTKCSWWKIMGDVDE